MDQRRLATLAQGRETTREETSAKKKRDQGGAGAAPAAGGGVLDTPLAIGIGGGVATALGIWAIGFNSDDDVSEDKPDR